MLWFTGVTSNHTGTHKETPVKQFAAATLLILVLAGCGGATKTDTSTSASSSAESTATSSATGIRLYGQRVGRHDRAVLV